MGFAFTMMMTFLTTIAVWLITKAFHAQWGDGEYAAGMLTPVLIGMAAGVSFFFWADVSRMVVQSMGAC